MKSFVEKHKTTLTSILTTIIIFSLIYFVIVYNPDARNHTVEQFSNSSLIVDNMYEEDGNTYLVLRDDHNEFVVTIMNSTYYNKYNVGDSINANRYVTVHQDGTEEIIYYFSEKK